MPELEQTLYQRIKSDLEAKAGEGTLTLAGEVASFSQEWFLTEEVDFFVVPNPAVDFDPEELRKFMASLKREEWGNSLSMSPDWRSLDLAIGSRLRSLLFGILTYHEPLKRYADLLDPAACLEYLDREDTAPNLHRFKSTRSISMRVYPNTGYARQIYVYQKGLTAGEPPNPVMDFLTHDITVEQIGDIRSGLARGGEVRLHWDLSLPPGLASSLREKEIW